MVKVQWPIKRDKKPKTFEDQILEKQFKTEAGLSEIKGTSFLKYRVESSDEAAIEMLNNAEQELKQIQAEKEDTDDKKQRLAMQRSKINLLILYKHFKRASAPWATAYDDRGMSERLIATEMFFWRNLDKPKMWSLVMAGMQFVIDVCYKELHTSVPPTIIIQTPVMKGYGGGPVPQGIEETVPEK